MAMMMMMKYVLVNAYRLNGMGAKALDLFYQIPAEFKDDVIYVCILNACSHSGLVDQARAIFKTIPIKTDYTYTTLVNEWIFEFFIYSDHVYLY